MKRKILRPFLGYILKLPLITWVLLGFSMSYLLFFIRPIFFSSQVMQFARYVPAVDPIGLDLKNTLGTAESWFVDKQNPYIENEQYAYPPFTSILVVPLLFVNLSLAYKIVTLINIFFYGMMTFLFPLRTVGKRRLSPLLILVLITGLFSYGFQFELERGQFNVIAVFMCFLGIWIYHYHNKHRCLAYILFIISVQLKVYPLIFIVMFINNWQDWKNNLKRVLILAAVNFALLFVFGPNVFVDFVKAITSQIVDPGIWTGNHSIHSFVTLFSKISYDHGWGWVNRYSGLAQIALLAVIIILIFLIMLQAVRQKQEGMNPFLLLACTIGALLIPSASHDYTLSILAAPVAVLLTDKRLWESANSPRRHIFFIETVFIFSAAYSSTLFSYSTKPLLVNNNFPALMIMMMIVTLLSLVSKPGLERTMAQPINIA